MCGLVGYCSRSSLGFSNPSTCCRRLSSSLSLNFFIFFFLSVGSQDLPALDLQRNPFNLHLPPIYPGPHAHPHAHPHAFFHCRWPGPDWGSREQSAHPAQAVQAFLSAPAAGGAWGQPPIRPQVIPSRSRAPRRPAAAAARSQHNAPRAASGRSGRLLAPGPGPEALPRTRDRVRCPAAPLRAATAAPRTGSAGDPGASPTSGRR